MGMSGTPKFEEELDQRANCELPFITLQNFTLTQGTRLLSLDIIIMRKRTQEVHLIHLEKISCMRREAF